MCNIVFPYPYPSITPNYVDGTCAFCGRNLTYDHKCPEHIQHDTTEFIRLALEAHENTKKSNLRFGEDV